MRPSCHRCWVFFALLQETLYNSPVVTAFNCTNSVSPIHDEEMIKPPESRRSPICCQANGAQRQPDGQYLLIVSFAEDFWGPMLTFLYS